MANPPERMGPYELVRRLGRGGMAETFRARRRGPGGFVQECCLKCVLPQYADDPEFRDQFLDEATVHGRLRHGNIVHVLDFGEHEGTYFLAMELVEGCDLAKLLNYHRSAGERFPVGLALIIAMDLCLALTHAHELATEDGPLNLVHRDLTPANVLLNFSGEVKLSDFGIARSKKRRHRTETGYTKGKLCYMSPEQIEGARDLDGRSDLFALGVVLYEMLAGRRPYQGSSGNDVSVLASILTGDHVPLAQACSSLSPGLCAVVERLLATDRRSRPASAREVLAALAPFAPDMTARELLAGVVQRVASPIRSAPNPPKQNTVPMEPEAEEQPYWVEPTRTSSAPARLGASASKSRSRRGAKQGEPHPSEVDGVSLQDLPGARNRAHWAWALGVCFAIALGAVAAWAVATGEPPEDGRQAQADEQPPSASPVGARALADDSESGGPVPSPERVRQTDSFEAPEAEELPELGAQSPSVRDMAAEPIILSRPVDEEDVVEPPRWARRPRRRADRDEVQKRRVREEKRPKPATKTVSTRETSGAPPAPGSPTPQAPSTQEAQATSVQETAEEDETRGVRSGTAIDSGEF